MLSGPSPTRHAITYLVRWVWDQVRTGASIALVSVLCEEMAAAILRALPCAWVASADRISSTACVSVFRVFGFVSHLL